MMSHANMLQVVFPLQAVVGFSSSIFVLSRVAAGMVMAVLLGLCDVDRKIDNSLDVYHPLSTKFSWRST